MRATPSRPAYWTALRVTGGQRADKVVNFGQNAAFGHPGQPSRSGLSGVSPAAAAAISVTGQARGAAGEAASPAR